jgi:hypothetical protein
MNRDAVNTALGLAGNMPMTDDDKKYNNLVYVFCKQLYLPALFTSLCALDWRSGRKDILLKPPPKYMPADGRYYYEMPAECIKPLYVDNNTTAFYNDRDLIITGAPAERLYCVYHNRNFNFTTLSSPGRLSDGMIIIRAPETQEELLESRQIYKDIYRDNKDDDFPEWEYTPYDADFWEYFSYRLAARLIPKLRADDGAAGRVQAMEALAAQVGAEAVKRSTSAATNPEPKNLYWHESLGLNVTYSDFRKYKAWK